MTPISSRSLAAYQKAVFLILPAVFLLGGLLSLATHPVIASLLMVIAAVLVAIWITVIRNYRDVYSDGASLVVEDQGARTVVPFDDILKVSPMFYLRAPVIVITYRASTQTVRICFVAISDSIADGLIDGSFFSKH